VSKASANDAERNARNTVTHSFTERDILDTYLLCLYLRLVSKNARAPVAFPAAHRANEA